jgi:hypothetical protein
MIDIVCQTFIYLFIISFIIQLIQSSYSLFNFIPSILLTYDQAFVSSQIIITILLSPLSGALIGFTLGMIGGGGSILAVPLLIYVVGISNTHIAIGTSAFAVAANSIVNMLYHKRKGHVNLKQGISFAIPGAIGTIIGTQLGLLTPSQSLLTLFGVFIIVISIKMLIEGRISKYKTRTTQEFISGSKDNDLNDYAIISRRSSSSSYCYDDSAGTTATIDRANNSVVKSNAQINNNKNNNNLTIKTRAFVSFTHEKNKQKIVLTGLLVGLAAGYFGIGGGFIVVPALMHTISGLSITDAIGTSLVPVSTFGSITAVTYSLSGEINWPIAILFVLGGIIGGLYGTKMSSKVPKDKLKKIFTILLIVVATYIIIESTSFWI